MGTPSKRGINFIGVAGSINNCACCAKYNAYANGDETERMEFMQVGNQYICTDCVSEAYLVLLKEKSGA